MWAKLTLKLTSNEKCRNIFKTILYIIHYHHTSPESCAGFSASIRWLLSYHKFTWHKFSSNWNFSFVFYHFLLIVQQVFLLAHCKDNGLYLRTLATGTELHCLKGHKSKVRRNYCCNAKLGKNSSDMMMYTYTLLPSGGDEIETEKYEHIKIIIILVTMLFDKIEKLGNWIKSQRNKGTARWFINIQWNDMNERKENKKRF